MNISEIVDEPIGTMGFYTERSREVPTDRRDMDFRAVHYEKCYRSIRVVAFYGSTAEEAEQKARSHDAKRKALREKWRKARQK